MTNLEQALPKTVAIVSPHRDDAAFSCGVFMELCLRRGVETTIVNVFTRSAYAPYAPPTVMEEVTHLRRGEDERMVRLLHPGCRMLDLGLLDAPQRLGISADQVVSRPLSVDQYQREVDQLAQHLGFLRSWDLVLLPQGIGEHHKAKLAGSYGSQIANEGVREIRDYTAARDGGEWLRLPAGIARSLQALLQTPDEG